MINQTLERIAQLGSDEFHRRMNHATYCVMLGACIVSSAYGMEQLGKYRAAHDPEPLNQGIMALTWTATTGTVLAALRRQMEYQGGNEDGR